MKIPGFNAESSLGQTLGLYRGKAIFGRLGTSDVLPMQRFGFLRSVFPIIRCCKYSRFAGKFVCVTRRSFPLEQCECIRPECPEGFPNCSEYPDFPYFECSPLVLSPD